MSQLELNKGDNFIFGIDVSASMQATDTPTQQQRIEYLKEKVITFAREASKYDPDGIDVLTFGQKVTPHLKITADLAEGVIKPLKANEGMTKTDQLIREAYKLHKAGAYEQTVLFIATDGAPADQEAVKTVIRDIAAELKEEHEFAISILTVGIPSTDLDAFLTDLDDNLKAKYDIVDVKRLEDVDFESAFSGALHD